MGRPPAERRRGRGRGGLPVAGPPWVGQGGWGDGTRAGGWRRGCWRGPPAGEQATPASILAGSGPPSPARPDPLPDGLQPFVNPGPPVCSEGSLTKPAVPTRGPCEEDPVPLAWRRPPCAPVPAQSLSFPHSHSAWAGGRADLHPLMASSGSCSGRRDGGLRVSRRAASSWALTPLPPSPAPRGSLLPESLLCAQNHTAPHTHSTSRQQLAPDLLLTFSGCWL